MRRPRAAGREEGGAGGGRARRRYYYLPRCPMSIDVPNGDDFSPRDARRHYTPWNRLSRTGYQDGQDSRVKVLTSDVARRRLFFGDADDPFPVAPLAVDDYWTTGIDRSIDRSTERSRRELRGGRRRRRRRFVVRDDAAEEAEGST